MHISIDVAISNFGSLFNLSKLNIIFLIWAMCYLWASDENKVYLHDISGVFLSLLNMYITYLCCVMIMLMFILP